MLFADQLSEISQSPFLSFGSIGLADTVTELGCLPLTSPPFLDPPYLVCSCFDQRIISQLNYSIPDILNILLDMEGSIRQQSWYNTVEKPA